MMTDAKLHEDQLALEKSSIQMGVERYRKGLEVTGQADSIPGMKLLKAAIPPLAVAIEQWKAEVEEGKGTKGLAAYHFINQFAADYLAYTTLKLAINGAASQLTMPNLAVTIAKVLEEGLNHDRLKAENPKFYGKYLDKVKSTNSYTHRVMFLKRQAAYVGMTVVKWTVSEKGRVGGVLLDLLLETTDLFEKIDTGHKSPDKLGLSQKAMEYLQEAHQRCEVLFPLHTPMVVRPRPWSTPFDGGYLTYRVNLVKSNNKAYLDELKGWDMPEVYRAVNALQDTKWQINQGILRLMKEVWDGGGNLGKLPPRDDIQPPPLPANFDSLSPEEQLPYRKQFALIKEENFRLMSKRISMINRLAMAEKFSQYETLYFPHSLDWRGRVYPMTGFLHPQADDSGKALLQFAEGKPLGDNGPYWLAVHLANTYGVDKVSFEERVQWVEENHENILEAAMNPLDGTRWWAKADSPWMFLAACQEWLGYTMQGKDYVSHLPVSWDGSCNGLQNFSAMLKDERGGAATNLVPSDKPADIYSEVARVAQAKVDADAVAGNEMAQLWVGKVTRKWAKRNTMTMPYGSGQFGFRAQLQEELRKYWYENGERYLEGGDDFHAGLYLAGVMYDSISSVVVAARAAMDWLQEVARIVSAEDLPLSWVTPAGFLVLQDYRAQEGQRLDFNVMGRRVRMTVNTAGTKLDRRKQAQGISPNYVHSMDASHMMKTVNACLDHGVTSFAMIHDSYGTHAADAETLSYLLRREFVNQYSTNVLEQFREMVLEALPEEKREKVPPVPPMGSLDLEAVMDSEYFFA